jgi:hypothetical protein
MMTICQLGLEVIVSKKLNAPYRSVRYVENLDQSQKSEGLMRSLFTAAFCQAVTVFFAVLPLALSW